MSLKKNNRIDKFIGARLLQLGWVSHFVPISGNMMHIWLVLAVDYNIYGKLQKPNLYVLDGGSR